MKPKTAKRRKTHRQKPKPATAAIVTVRPVPEKPWELDTEAITILKNSIAKGASDNELQYCLTVARRYKVDPFKRQIWFIRRWDASADDGKGGKGAYIYTPQIGIDGLLFIAARDHRDFGSVSLPVYGPMVRVGSIQAPEWARVKVWKKGEPEPTEAEAYWDEYAPDVDAKSQSGAYKAPFWRKMPRRMISKCAIALAIRQAYPDLGGLYIPEECEKMGEDVTPNGRQIIEQGTREAAQVVGQQKADELRKQIAGRTPDATAAPEAGAGAARTGPPTAAPAPKKIPGLVTISAGEKPQTITVNVALATGAVRDQLHAFLIGDVVRGAWLEVQKVFLCPDTPDVRFAIREKCGELGVEGTTKAGTPLPKGAKK